MQDLKEMKQHVNFGKFQDNSQLIGFNTGNINIINCFNKINKMSNNMGNLDGMNTINNMNNITRIGLKDSSKYCFNQILRL